MVGLLSFPGEGLSFSILKNLGLCGQPAYMPSASTPPPSSTEGVSMGVVNMTAVQPIGSSPPQFPIIAPADSNPGATAGGRRKFPPEEHIVGGDIAVKYSLPWMAALLIDKKHFCGGKSTLEGQSIKLSNK